MRIIKRSAQLVRMALRKVPKAPEDAYMGPMLSTGSSLLNLAISDRTDGGLIPGKYYFIVGDSNSGKTFWCMTSLAEAMQHPHFRDYRLIYDNVEDGMLMNVERLFGKRVAERIEPPSKVGDSETIEQFYYNLHDAIQRGKPFIYVLDSMDGLDSESAEDKFEERKQAHRKGKEVAGSYGDGKAKMNSTILRTMLKGLRATGSILIIVGQTRENLNAGVFGNKKTRSGGKALRFYATVEVWTSPTGSIAKTIRGRARKVGTGIKLQVVKNRITGKLHEVETTIYPSYGIDDLGSCVDYLVSERWWVKSKGKTNINATDLKTKGPRDKLIALCEADDDKRQALMRAVSECWAEVERAKNLTRKPRYR